MARQQSAGRSSARRYSEVEKAQVVRLVRALRAELGTDHGTVRRVADLNRTGFGGGSGVPRFARSGWWISDGGLRRTVVAPTAFASAQRAPIEFDRIVVAVASDAT